MDEQQNMNPTQPSAADQQAQQPNTAMPTESQPTTGQPPTPQQPMQSAGNNKPKKPLLLVAIIIVVLLVLGATIFVLAKGKSDNSASETHTDTTSNNTNTDSSSTDPNSGALSQTPAAGDVTAEIKDFAFTPTTITVKKGAKVTWTNKDTVQHNVISDDNSQSKGLSSELLAQGESYSFTFTEAGTYSYHCGPHPSMTGTVVVK